MLSQVALYNAALAKLGDSFVIDPGDDSKQARACNEAYVRVRDALLRAHRWTFALTRVQLAALTSVPAFEFKLQYQLPVDCLKLTQVGELYVGVDLSDYRNAPSAEYRIEGRLLLCDLKSPLNIRYLRRVEDSTQFDPLFDDALACKLAIEICNTLTQSDGLKQGLMQEFKGVIASATRANCIEQAPEPLPDDTWELSRV